MTLSPSHLDNQLDLDTVQARLRDLETVIETTEKLVQTGHYEWDWSRGCLGSCSVEYAKIFDMTVSLIMDAQSSWEKMLKQIHPDDVESYTQAAGAQSDTGNFEVTYRIVLNDNTIKHIRETSIVIKDPDELGKSSLGVLQDITEQVERENELGYRGELAQQAEAIADIGHFIYDELNENYTFLSAGYVRIYGTTAEAYMAKMQSFEDDLSDIHPDDRERVGKAYLRYLKTAGESSIEYRIIRSNGQVRWIRELGKVRRVKDGKPVETLGVIQDITNQKTIEQTLIYKDALANQAEAITDIGHFVYDELEQLYLFVSPGLARIHGVGEVDLMSRQASRDQDLARVHRDDRERVRKAYYNAIINNESWQVEYRLVRSNDEVRWVKEMGKAHLINEGIVQQTVGVLQDITEKKNTEEALLQSRDTLEQQVLERTQELSNTVKKLEEQIEERKKVEAELDFLANHDALTGLPSLRLCKDRLDRSLAAARRNTRMTAVMFFDLDGFKKVNDMLGHESGDQILMATAKRIQQEIRETDTVARIGGDEFIIILSDLLKMSAVQTIAANIIKKVSQPVSIDQNEVTVSASIGIALYPEHGTTSDQLIQAADKAMYEVKKSGKNNFAVANMNEPKITLIGGGSKPE
jgi:diguanylate cyclase (GGDEF)-like protein/PAS domain S-box-containing protein